MISQAAQHAVHEHLASQSGRRPFVWLVGFLVGFPLFVSPYSAIVLANGNVYNDVFAVPLSLLFLPLALLYGMTSRGLRLDVRTSWLLLMFVSLTVTGLLNIVLVPQAIPGGFLHFFQWLLPFFWLSGCLLYLQKSEDRRSFFRGFAFGVILFVFYIASCAAMEVFLHGALLDSGRMTQNLILPGQYQLYIYTATHVAFSAAVVTLLYRTLFLEISAKTMAVFHVLCVASLLAIAAREGILVYVIGVTGALCVGSVKRTFLAGAAFVAALGILIYMVATVEIDDEEVEFRLVSKIAALASEDRSLGYRDEMIETYLGVIEKSPMWGTSFLPPGERWSEFSSLPASAHNYYVDVLAWGGVIFAALTYTFIVILLAMAVMAVVNAYVFPDRVHVLASGMAFLLILFLLASNNINVPMRQPVTAPLFGMLVTLGVVVLSKSRRYP